jgi:DNA-binding CsgD family transcriptional regulator
MGQTEVVSGGLIGRERECAEIATLLERARHGRGGSLVIRGEAGIGKTALLEYAAGLADGMTVLRAVGVDEESDLAFAGLFGLLRPVLDRLGELVGTQATALAGALGLEPASNHDRLLISAAVLGLLAVAAEECPVVCLIDDAHWLDQPSAEAISFAARRLGADRIAIVFGVRQGESRRFEGSGMPELVLTGLDEAAARALLSTHGRQMASTVRDRLLARAEGNPLALVELPSGLTDVELAGQEPLPEAIPLTPRLQGLFRRRIEQLPSSTRTVLLIAAADNTGDLSAVLRAAAQFALGPDTLAPAEHADLLRTGGDAIAFRHPLVRAAAYEAATLSERQRAHAALANVLTGDEHADRRVWHQAMASVAGDEEVAAALEASARRAQLRGGHASAASAFQRAAELTNDASHRTPRLAAAAQAAWDAGQAESAAALVTRALATAGGILRARLLHLRGLIESRSGRTADAVRTLGEAIEASTDSSFTLEILHDAVDAAFDVGDHVALRAFGARAASLPARTRRDRFNQAAVAGYAAQCEESYDRAREAFGGALAVARELDDPVVLLWAAQAASIGYGVGAGVPFATRALELARAQGLLSLLPLVLDQLGTELARTGQFERAYAAAEEGYKLSVELGVGHVACHLENMARVEAVYGREADAREHADQAITIARRSGLRLEAYTRASIGLLELTLGRADRAASILLELVNNPRHHQLPHQAFAPLPDAIEAVMRSSRDATLVEEPLERYRDWVLAAPTDARRSLLARCQALVGARPAEEAFGEALELAEALSVFERARTELLYGEWLRRERRRTEARPHLRLALEQFESLGAGPWAARSEAELRASGETARKREPATLDQLTPRERTITELAASGLTNPEIGAQLFLSPRTVEYHLSKVFSKLGIASRSELFRQGFVGGEAAKAAGG